MRYLCFFTLIAALMFFPAISQAQTSAQAAAPSVQMDEKKAEKKEPMMSDNQPLNAEGEFTKHRYKIRGNWAVNSQDGVTSITFSDDFKTKGGPDLKIFLSPKKLSGLTGRTAIDGGVKLGILKSNKGEQSYSLPEDINLSDYQSVIIHCEAYAVLWGGFDIPG